MSFLLVFVFSLLFTTVASIEQNPWSCTSENKGGDWQTESGCESKKVREHHDSDEDPLPHEEETSLFPTKTVHLPLHHHQPRTPVSAVLDHDARRITSLSSRLGVASRLRLPRRPNATSPLFPGAPFSVGNYVTNITLGTSSRPSLYPMVVDTGSSFSWLQCLPCSVSCHPQVTPIFNPAASSSFTSVRCSSPQCSLVANATMIPTRCSKNKTCVYTAAYGDGSVTAGYLANDTLKIGKISLPGFFFGCGLNNRGLLGKAAGMIGLGRDDISLIHQAKRRVGKNAFTYCLPTPSSIGSLTLGPYNSSRYSYTKMLTTPLDNALYLVNLTGVTLAGKYLHVHKSAYSVDTVIDSGTVISRLPPQVYSALSKGVVKALKGRYRRAPAYSILDTCFFGQVKDMGALPKVAIVYEGGAEMRLPTGNAFLDADKKTMCLAFAAASTRVAIVGNRQQQTFSVVYDVEKERIGFASGGCG